MKHWRIVLWLIVLCLFGVMAAKSQTQLLQIRQFKGNDTRTSDRLVEPNYSRVANNIDFSRVLGEIAKRKGYAFVDSLFGDTSLASNERRVYDSLIAMYPVFLSDGKQALIFGVSLNVNGDAPNTDVDSSRWGNLYMTSFGTASLDSVYSGAWGQSGTAMSLLYEYWNQSVPIYFTTFNDIVYASNGSHRGAAIDINTQHSATWPLPAPGEPRVTPVAAPQSSYQLNGEYRYAFKALYWDNGVSTSTSLGIVSAPIRATNGHVILSDFPFIPSDSVLTPDSAHVQFFRTKKNPGRLTETDSVFALGSTKILRSSGTSFGTRIFVDSISDDSLGAGLLAIDPARLGADSSRVLSRRYGAPSYVSSVDSVWRLQDSARNFIWGGSFGSHSAADSNRWPIAYGYMTTFYDTLLDVESDSSRTEFVYDPAGTDKIRTVRLGMSQLPSGMTHTVRRLYRAMMTYSGRDTAIAVYPYCDNSRSQIENDWITVNGLIHEPYYLGEIHSSGSGWCFDKMLKTITRDTIVVTPYIMVAEIPADSQYYTDSTRFDSLVQHRWYTQKTPPPFLTSIFGYNNYLFGLQGSRLYQSQQDTSGFGVFSFVSVNEDDGDQGTLARPTRRAIRFYKNKSRYNVYQDDDGVYRQYEFVDGVGCIAPQSGVMTPFGFVYLSDAGVILENDGEYLERTVRSGIISSRLDNFEKMSIAVKSKAKGVYADNKYILYIPSPVDTSFVYDFPTESWATWSIPISGAALYGTETVVNHLPGDTLFFYKPNGRSLFKYGVGESDMGDSIVTTWKSVPLLADGYINQVLKIGTWTLCDSDLSLNGSITKETGVISPALLYSDDMSDYFQVRELQSGFYGKYLQIGISCTSVVSFSISGFDIHWRRYEAILNGAAH